MRIRDPRTGALTGRRVEAVAPAHGRTIARRERDRAGVAAALERVRPAAAGPAAVRASVPVHDGSLVAQNVFHTAFADEHETSLRYADRAYRRSEALTVAARPLLRRVA